MIEKLFQTYKIIEFVNFENVENNDVNCPLEFMKVSYTYHFGLGCYRNEFHRDFENGVVIGIISRRISKKDFERAYYTHLLRHTTPIILK